VGLQQQWRYAFFSETPAALPSCSRSVSGYRNLLALCTLIQWSQLCISGHFDAVVPRRLQRCRDGWPTSRPLAGSGRIDMAREWDRQEAAVCGPHSVWSTHSTDVGPVGYSECACEQGYHLLLWHLQTRCCNYTMRARSEQLTGPDRCWFCIRSSPLGSVNRLTG